MLEYVSCNLCGGNDTLKLPAYYIFQGQRLDLVKCRQCSLVYINPRPDAGMLKKLYSLNYFEKDWDCGCSGKTYLQAREKLIAMYKANTLAYLKKIGKAGRILDLGCAGGHFLVAAREEGWEPWGIEICVEMAAIAAVQPGLRIFTLEMVDCPLPAHFFTVVQMGDVLEHMMDPLGTLREVWRVLKSGGLLVVHAPVSYARLKPEDQAGLIKELPYHIYEFHVPTLKAMLEKAGFLIVEKIVDWLPGTPPEERSKSSIERMSFYACKQ